MEEAGKMKEQLPDELTILRQHVARLEAMNTVTGVFTKKRYSGLNDFEEIG